MKFKFKTINLLAGVFALLAMDANAQQIGVDAAIEIARSHFSSPSISTGIRRAPSNVTPELAYSAQTERGTAFYVFNNGKSGNGGFVIVGGDKISRPVLGFSESGHFDADNLPENVRWWLSQYSEEFRAAKKSGVKTSSVVVNASGMRKASASRHSIDPMIKTKWNQSEPYNNAIPTLGTGYSKFVTGCVATAMAQVMYYHNTPEANGVGEYGYTINYNGTMPVYFSANYATTYYDWNNMLLEYKNGSYDSLQAEAVATLMYHAGVSVKMNYNSSKSGGSGASSAKIPAALIDHFGYDKSAYEASRKYYSDSEWEDLIYGELADGRPVLYGGQDYKGGGGHQFICDGYDAYRDFYSFNWGWGGFCDGYYAISGINGTGVLQPNGNGIGGAGEDAAYTVDQSAIINVMPDNGGSYHDQIAVHEDYKVSSNSTEFNTLEVGADNPSMIMTVSPLNVSGRNIAFSLGIAFRNIITDEMVYSSVSNSYNQIAPSQYYINSSISFTPEVIQYNGEYEIVPVFRVNSSDSWQPLLINNSFVKPRLSVSGRQSAVPVDVTFAITSVSVPVRSTLTISHDKLYNGNVIYSSSNTAVATVSETGIVTGVAEGTATITAKAESTTYFNETTQTFDITVTPFELLGIDFTIDKTLLEKGETAQISWNNDYSGAVTYSIDNPSIVSVSSTGLVTALESGSTTITVSGAAAGDYKVTEVPFTITVADEYPDGVKISDFKVANKGYVTPDSFKFSYKYTNMKNENNGSSIYAKVTNGYFTSTSGLTWSGPGNYSNVWNVDLAQYENYFNSYITNYNHFTVTFLATDKETVLKCDGKESQDLYVCAPLSVEFNMTNAGWGTICLPYEATVPDGLTAFTVGKLKSNNLSLLEVTDGKLEMGVPYILSGTVGTYTFTGPDVPYQSNLVQSGPLAGTVGADVALQEGDYILQNQDGVVGFYKIGSDVAGQSASQYRAFIRLVPNSTFQDNLCFSIAQVTAIEDIEDTKVDVELIYNLNGQLVNELQSGFNVIKKGDGSVKKVFVK